MALPQKVNLGTSPNNGTGDALRIAFGKLNIRDEYLDERINGIKQVQIVTTLPDQGELLTLYAATSDKSLNVWNGSSYDQYGGVEVTYQIVIDALGYIPEPELGNPVSDGMVLASTAAGVRSWVVQESSGGGVTQQYVDDADEATLASANTYTNDQLGGKEDTANKAINFTTVNDTLYPTLQAIVNYVNSLGFITDYTVTQGDVLAALGYTPENAANKATTLNTSNNTLYPTVKAVLDYLQVQGYITSYTVTENDVISALGFNPVKSVNNNLPDETGNVNIALPEPTDSTTVKTLTQAKALIGLQNGDYRYILGRVKEGDGLIQPNPFYFYPDDVTPADDATVIEVEGGRLKAPILFGEVNVRYFGATGLESQEFAPIFQNIINSVPGVPIIGNKNDTYRWSQKITAGNQDVIFKTNGAKVLQASSERLLELNPGLDWSANVTSLSVVDEVFDTSVNTPASRGLRISVASVPDNVKAGTVLKLTSEDIIPFTKPIGSSPADSYGRLGQFIVVGKITGNDIYTTGVPEYIESYVTNIKIHKPGTARYIIDAPYITALEEGGAAGWNLDLILIRNAVFPEVKLEAEKLWSPAVAFHGCYMYKAEVNVRDFATLSGTRVGYGVKDVGSQFGEVRVKGHKVRHAFATNLSFVSASNINEIDRYGLSLGTQVFDSIAYSCDNAAFDAHEGAYGISFSDCKTYNNYAGNTSEGSGLTVRGRKLRYNNVEVIGARKGISLFSQYADNNTSDIEISDSNFDVYDQVISTGSSGFKISNVRFDNCTFKTSTEDLFGVNELQAIFNKCTFEITSDSFVRFISLGTNNDFLFIDCTFISKSTSATHRAVWLQGPGNRVRFQGNTRYISAKTVNRFAFGNSQSGTIKAGNITFNHPVTEILNTGQNLNDFSYSFNFDIEGQKPYTTSIINQDITATPAVDFANLLEKEITVRAALTAHSTISGLTAPRENDAVLKIINTSNLYKLTIVESALVGLVNAKAKVIQPGRTLVLVWNGTKWIEEKAQQTLTKEIKTSDSAFQIGAGTELLILNTAITANRALSLRDPAEYDAKELVIINNNSTAFFWSASTGLKDGFGNIKTPLNNRAIYNLVSDGVNWVVKSEFTQSNRAENLTGTLLNLSNTSGINYNYSDPIPALTYTFTNPIINGYADAYINASAEPTVTGATKDTNRSGQFLPNTVMIMRVESPDGINAVYYFLNVGKGNRPEKPISNVSQYTVPGSDSNFIGDFTANAGQEIVTTINAELLTDPKDSFIYTSSGNNTISFVAGAGVTLVPPTGMTLKTVGKGSYVTIRPFGGSLNTYQVVGTLVPEGGSTLTGTSIKLSEMGNNYNHEVPLTSTTYSVDVTISPKVNYFARLFHISANEPTISGATKKGGDDFTPNAEMEIVFDCPRAGVVEYRFYKR